MKMKLILVSLLLPVLALAELQVGDIILQPLRCKLCRLIEAQERTTFSHMGVVIKLTPEVMVGEAFGNVRMVPLRDFVSKGDLTRPARVIRLKEEVRLSLEKPAQQWLGNPYDDQFLWDNVDQQGREPLYCSEFVTKLLNPFLKKKIPTKAMDFSVDREAWWNYFHGEVPDGQPGNSPGDFDRSPLFKTAGSYLDGTWNWN